MVAGIPLCQVKVDMGLQVTKILSTCWIISGWQGLDKQPEVVVNRFKKAGWFSLVFVVLIMTL